MDPCLMYSIWGTSRQELHLFMSLLDLHSLFVSKLFLRKNSKMPSLRQNLPPNNRPKMKDAVQKETPLAVRSSFSDGSGLSISLSLFIFYAKYLQSVTIITFYFKRPSISHLYSTIERLAEVLCQGEVHFPP